MTSENREATLSLEGVDPLPLFGQADSNLRALEERFGVEVASRGESLRIAGAADGGHRVPFFIYCIFIVL